MAGGGDPKVEEKLALDERVYLILGDKQRPLPVRVSNKSFGVDEIDP